MDRAAPPTAGFEVAGHAIPNHDVAGLAVAVLVLLAGCGGGVATRTGTYQPSGTPEADSTAATATTNGTQETRNLPPGVGSEGVDVAKLVRAHRQALSRAAVTVTVRRSVVGGTGTTLAVARTVIRSNGDRVVVHEVVAGTAPGQVGLRGENFTYWSSGEETAIRRVLPDGNARYTFLPGDGPKQFEVDTTGGDRVLGALDGRDLAATWTVRRGGLTLVVLRSTADRTTSIRGQVRRNLTVRAFVTRAGVVRSFRLAYETTLNGEPVTVRVSFRLDNVTTTTVGRPAWVDVARNASRGSDRP